MKQLNLIQADQSIPPESLYTHFAENFDKLTHPSSWESLKSEFQSALKEDFSKAWTSFVRAVFKHILMKSAYNMTLYSFQDNVREEIKRYVPEFLKRFRDGVNTEGDAVKIPLYSDCAKIVWEHVDNQGIFELRDLLKEYAELYMDYNVPISWLSPMGVNIISSYPRYRTNKLRMKFRSASLPAIVVGKSKTKLELNERAISFRQRVANSVDKQRTLFGLAPNYIHSIDASIIGLTAIRLKQRNNPFYPIHDSIIASPGHMSLVLNALLEVNVEIFSLLPLKQFFERLDSHLISGPKSTKVSREAVERLKAEFETILSGVSQDNYKFLLEAFNMYAF